MKKHRPGLAKQFVLLNEIRKIKPIGVTLNPVRNELPSNSSEVAIQLGLNARSQCKF